MFFMVLGNLAFTIFAVQVSSLQEQKRWCNTSFTVTCWIFSHMTIKHAIVTRCIYVTLPGISIGFFVLPRRQLPWRNLHTINCRSWLRSHWMLLGLALEIDPVLVLPWANPPLTFSHLKMDGWNMYYLPFGMAYFQRPMLVLGGVRIFFLGGGEGAFLYNPAAGGCVS